MCVIERYNKQDHPARVVKWYTRSLEVAVPQGVEVQLLSRAPKENKVEQQISLL